MTIRIVRLGSKRDLDEGLRIGTVRRPPRGVRKDRIAAEDWYDVWLPELSPSADLVKQGLAADSDRDWEKFARKYRAEMAKPEAARLIQLLAALSRNTNFSAGCYCENENRCHRSLLRELLIASGADLR